MTDPTAPKTYRVIFTGHMGDKRIPGIKAIREATGWGLPEAKAASDAGYIDGLSESQAASVTKHLESVGVVVSNALTPACTLPAKLKRRKLGRNNRLAMYRAAALGSLVGSASAFKRWQQGYGVPKTMGFYAWCASEAEEATLHMLAAETDRQPALMDRILAARAKTNGEEGK